MGTGNNRSAIVMGATSGIGFEVAKVLACRGWRVCVAGRRENILASMTAETDGIVAYEVIDVTSPQAAEALCKLIDKTVNIWYHIIGRKTTYPTRRNKL